jgi:hypothetical protein
MNLNIETTPEQDLTLQKQLDDYMAGRGNEKPPTLEEFTLMVIENVFSAFVLNAKVAARNELRDAIDKADEAKIAQVAAILK